MTAAARRQAPAAPRRGRGWRRVRQRLRDDERGSSSVEFAILAPAVLLLVMIVIQVGVAYHSHQVAQTAARHGVDEVRTRDGSTGAGISAANDFLAQAGGGLRGTDVSASRGAEVSSVSVSGNVVSIVPFVSFTVDVTVNAPTERIVQP